LAAEVREGTDDAVASVRDSWPLNERKTMDTFFILVAFVFVFAVLAVVAYALFEVSPFAQHKESFRDPRTGKRRWQSPRLD
jgi:hypothetical protein